MSEDGLQEVHWTPLIEKYFAATAERAHGYSMLHRRCEAIYSRLDSAISLPCIILSTLNGATSIGSQSLFGTSSVSSYAIGLTALLTAILQVVGTYFAWQKRSAMHRVSSLQYGRLFRHLCVQMGLPRGERTPPQELLRQTKDAYDRLAETSPLIPANELQRYRGMTADPLYKNVAKVEESNGLIACVVYAEGKDKDIHAPNSPVEGGLRAPVPPPPLRPHSDKEAQTEVEGDDGER